MTNVTRFFAIVAIIIAAISFSHVKAQDVVKTNPKQAKLLCDTGGVRMILVTWKPGQQLAPHTHPISEMYVLSGGQLTVTHTAGPVDTLNLKTGAYMQTPPEIQHTTKNTGTTNVKIILVEIKQKKAM